MSLDGLVQDFIVPRRQGRHFVRIFLRQIRASFDVGKEEGNGAEGRWYMRQSLTMKWSKDLVLFYIAYARSSCTHTIFLFGLPAKTGYLYFFGLAQLGIKSNGGRWLSFKTCAPVSLRYNTETEPVSHARRWK